MLVAIDNGGSYEDHCIYFVDFEILAGHRYTIRDVEEIISILNPEKSPRGLRILFIAHDVTPCYDGVLSSFSDFVFGIMHNWEWENIGPESAAIYCDLKDVSVDLSERLKSDLKVEFAKFIKSSELGSDIKFEIRE